MFSLEGDTRIIDTPGLREFGLMDIEPEELGDLLHGIRQVCGRKCGFSPCTHDHEPDCEVKKRSRRERSARSGTYRT